jgi:hypothetical protein
MASEISLENEEQEVKPTQKRNNMSANYGVKMFQH